MDRTFIDSLLHRAKTLADYAVDTGQLPEGSRIFEEIELMTQAAERGETRAIAPLITEMQKVSNNAHVTVDQLVRRETTLGRLREGAALVTPYLIGIMTLLLTLYLAFQSSELNKADLALREYQDLQNSRLHEKVYNAWKMYRYERVLNVKAPPLAQLDGYQQLVDDARRLFEKRNAVETLMTNAEAIRYVPEFVEQFTERTPPGGASAANQKPDEGSKRSVLAPSSEFLAPPSLDCSEKPLPPGAKDKSVPLESRIELENYQRSIECFANSLGLNYYDDPTMVALTYSVRNKVNLLVSWLLPGLYGLLGACVFLMRELLFVNRQRGFHRDTRIVDVLSMLLRVALGGLAGIIIGWFWVPTAPTANSSPIAISSISFAVAFLAGFSIDSLFALLDRLVKNFREPDEDRPAGSGKTVEEKA